MFWRRKTKPSEIRPSAVTSFTYDAVEKLLVVEFADGTQRRHPGVNKGAIVGLEVAGNKRDFYDSEICPRFRDIDDSTVVMPEENGPDR
ncbi:KTSC domain-containing protein [Rhizobium puerariae]